MTIAKKENTILITGAGGVAVPALIKNLQKMKYNVIAADMDINAPGLYVADKGVIIPSGKSPIFADKIIDLINKESIDIIVPLVDEELLSMADLENEKVKVILPSSHFIKVALDKYKLMNVLKAQQIPVPKTILLSDWDNQMKFPLIVKPRIGRGSRDIHIIYNQREMITIQKKLFNQSKDYIIQQFIEGTEYTVSVVVWKDGLVQAVVPKEIISKKGVTRLAITRKNEDIDNICRKVEEALHANGPFNVQLIVDECGKPYIFEINPRYSTSISLTIASGVDELGMIIDQILNKRISEKIDNWQDGIVMIRRSLDEFINEKDFNKRLLELGG